MSPTINFMGTNYDSLDAMPPDVRAAFEADRQKRVQALLDARLTGANANRTQAPAWGGARSDGSVPVPVGFDQVTNLGPAIHVTAHQGVRLPSFGTPHVTAMVRYSDGLAYQTGGKDVHALRWDEVAAIQSNQTRQIGEQPGISYTQHEYTLTRQGGEKFILDSGLKDVVVEAPAIKAAVFALLAPPLAQRYEAGQALTFGPVTVHKQNGLQLDGKPYAWAAIQDIKVERGRLKVTLRDGKKHEARVSAIPNVELLCQMIGVNLLSTELAYY